MNPGPWTSTAESHWSGFDIDPALEAAIANPRRPRGAIKKLLTKSYCQAFGFSIPRTPRGSTGNSQDLRGPHSGFKRPGQALVRSCSFSGPHLMTMVLPRSCILPRQKPPSRSHPMGGRLAGGAGPCGQAPLRRDRSLA
jgi:hypothetical protein